MTTAMLTLLTIQTLSTLAGDALLILAVLLLALVVADWRPPRRAKGGILGGTASYPTLSRMP